MRKIFLSMFLILLLLPISDSFSQKTDTEPTLTLTIKNETFVYQDESGHTIIVGMVENTNSISPVTNVALQAKFYDDYSPSPLEVVEGTTILEVIPANGKSPFVIRSETPNSNITQASASLLTFDSSVEKPKGLTVFSSDVFLDENLHFAGVLRNSGAPISDTNVYLAYYDAFKPPRFLGVTTIEVGSMEPNEEKSIQFVGPINSRAVGFLLFSESDVFYSDFVDIKIPSAQIQTKMVTISDVSVEDNIGNKLSELKQGETVFIKSKTLIQFANNQQPSETPYTYYVQIKESGEHPFVEYIGKFDGRFIDSGLETQTIDWIPENKGLYFIETFVWDRNNVPLSERGPFVLIVVN